MENQAAALCSLHVALNDLRFRVPRYEGCFQAECGARMRKALMVVGSTLGCRKQERIIGLRTPNTVLTPCTAFARLSMHAAEKLHFPCANI
jgi:hypothetical protein